MIRIIDMDCMEKLSNTNFLKLPKSMTIKKILIKKREKVGKEEKEMLCVAVVSIMS